MALRAPAVQIILPCYNCSRTVEETLISIQKQLFPDFQCLMIDDCSTDNTSDILRHFESDDSRFVYLKTPCNQGVSQARNLGLSWSSAEFLAFLDSDDIWHPNFLSRALNSLSTGFDFVYCPILRFFDTVDRVAFYKASPKVVTLRSLLTNNHIPLSAVLFRSHLFRDDFWFKEQRPEDYIFWINLFQNNPGLKAYRFSKNPYLFYRVSASQRSANKLKNIKRAYKVYRQCWGFGRILSSIMSCVYVMNSFVDYIFQYSSPRKFPFHLWSS